MTTTRIKSLRAHAWILGIGLSLFLAGCEQSFSDEKQELESGRTVWATEGPQSYEMAFTMHCNCKYDGQRQNALICNRKLRMGDFSVDSIFELADLAIADGDESLLVNMNTEFGYPESIRFGSSLGFDSEVEFVIEGVRPIDDGSTAECQSEE